MALPTRESRKRITILMGIVSLLVLALMIRLGYLQMVKGDELRAEALNQWTKGITIEPKRGTIYDRNGKELAISLKRDTVWVRVSDIPEDKLDGTVDQLSEILNLNRDDLYQRFTGDNNIFMVKRWIDPEQSDKLKKSEVRGISVVEDNMRYYPNEDFAPYVIGHTNSDQVGQYGVERIMNSELKGVAGKLIESKDGHGETLPFDRTRIYEPEDGKNIKLTLDANIQKFAEEALAEAIEKHKPKNAAAIVMDPKTGDILAMASGPGYDLNEPRDMGKEYTEEELEAMDSEQRQNLWYDMWRNYNVNDAYEPGSTFKTLVVAAAVEEGLIDENSTYYCDGYADGLSGNTPVRCWSYLDPHGHQTLAEGLKNSCNVVMVDIGLQLGKEKMYDYIKSFGFGEQTGIELSGESSGIIPRSAESIQELTLANISFGQGVAVTPVQLVTAISSLANDGNLMKPNIVESLLDEEGKVVSEVEPEVIRKVISEDVADRTLAMMEFSYDESYSNIMDIPGYRVGAKTGTSQKIVDGAYSREKHIGSFVGVAPISDPQIVVLTIVDEPTEGGYYGSVTAAPIAESIINRTLNYMGVEKDSEDAENTVKVPTIVGRTVGESMELLKSMDLDYVTDSYYIDPELEVKAQEPEPSTSVETGSFVKIYTEELEEDLDNGENAQQETDEVEE